MLYFGAKEMFMAQTITAVFEKGVFIPQTKVELPEHARVKVVIPDEPAKLPVKNLKGALAGLGIHLCAEDFNTARHEM